MSTQPSHQQGVFTEDALLPLSALQHYLFCPRQCALIHLEQVWADNAFTAEGNVLHKKAHDGHDELISGVKITRSLPVRSLQLGVSGQCDIVEFHQDDQVIPIEYKRGKPKATQLGQPSPDEIQLCAQALCLEEMLSTSIPHGFIYYGLKKRRTQIPFTPALRNHTHRIAQELHSLIQERHTPTASYISKKCDSCSLIHLCQPKTLRLQRGAASWFQAQLNTLEP